MQSKDWDYITFLTNCYVAQEMLIIQMSLHRSHGSFFAVKINCNLYRYITRAVQALPTPHFIGCKQTCEQTCLRVCLLAWILLLTSSSHHQTVSQSSMLVSMFQCHPPLHLLLSLLMAILTSHEYLKRLFAYWFIIMQKMQITTTKI